MAARTATATAAPVKPRLRGVSHEIAFYVFVPACLVLVLAAPAPARFPVTVYALAAVGLFGASALFHRPTWSPPVRRWLRKLDHSMIFIMIAGSYTAVAGLALGGMTRTLVLTVVWAGAVAGVITKIAWIDSPKWLSAIAYISIGWVAVIALPQFVHALGWGGFALIAVGGLSYTVGAVIHARRRPDPVPSVFGYHEVFHALVIGGATAHFFVIAFVVVPAV